MQGNAAEWCLDAWRDYPKQQQAATVDRFHAGDPQRDMFVVRGGAFWMPLHEQDDFAERCTSYYRQR
jgi:formylglycine-generating enzyme required for sulfatase activity